MPVSGQEHSNTAHRRVYCDTSGSEKSLFDFGDDKFNTTYISIHTDDLDIIGESLEDIKEIVKILDDQFGHEGNAGIKVIDPKEVLGVRRVEGTTGNGTRYLHLHQAFKCDELWDTYGEECPRRSPPRYPFPYSKEKHPEITNDGKHVGGSEEEARRIHAKGYRQVIGSILWLARNAAPIVSYGASILSKCMQAPDQQAWDAAMHVVQYLKNHGKQGITYHSAGNLEPVCYYDSGFNQTKLQTHPQYGFIIYWCGAPTIWRSKRHPLTPHSVSQAEHQTLRHAWSYIKWLRELLKDLGLGQYVRRPTLCIGDNRNARDWANERVLSEGNQHLDRHYFTVRERVAMGEILPIWIEGLYNPADTMTKAINAQTAEQHMKYIYGQEEIPLPDGIKVWFGPPDQPALRGNLVPPATVNSANTVQATPVMDSANITHVVLPNQALSTSPRYEPTGDLRRSYDLTADSSDDEGPSSGVPMRIQRAIKSSTQQHHTNRSQIPKGMGIKSSCQRGRSPMNRRRSSRTKATADPTTLENQLKMASDNLHRYQRDMIVMRSPLGGRGLFARRHLPSGYEVDYYGEFFDSVEALEKSGQGESQYVIGRGKGKSYSTLVNGERVSRQFAIYANHQPGTKANAKLTWDNDRYIGRSPRGQPVLMLTAPVDPGDEITVDYGPHFAYKKHGFSRDSAATRKSRATDRSTTPSAYLVSPSVIMAV